MSQLRTKRFNSIFIQLCKNLAIFRFIEIITRKDFRITKTAVFLFFFIYYERGQYVFVGGINHKSISILWQMKNVLQHLLWNLKTVLE